MAATLGAGLLALQSLLPATAGQLADLVRRSLLEMGGPTAGVAVVPRMGEAVTTTVTLVLPLAGLVAAAGLAANLAGGGLVLAPTALRFDWGRINPARGLRRLADRQVLLRLLLALIKLAILAAVAWLVLAGRAATLLALDGATAPAIAGAALAAIFQLGLSVTLLLVAVGVADAVIQRRRALGNLRMTRDEVRRELRETEGDPLIRSHRRRRARQLAYARMMEAVRRADVVVTNPVHLAVALRYDPRTMRAPTIVAKGQRLMAERIREVARRHGVPIVEDRPLARALFARPLGSEVPPHLYRAVARVLVLVHRIRRPAAAATGLRTAPGPGATR
jgi:flagellar biosynthetic protein FlhB